MSKVKKLPVPNLAGVSRGKPSKGDCGGPHYHQKLVEPAQCPPTEANPTRMQHQWAAAPDLGPIPKGYDK